jgi:hypothetical protein
MIDRALIAISLDKCYIESWLQNLRQKGGSEVPSIVLRMYLHYGTRCAGCLGIIKDDFRQD